MSKSFDGVKYYSPTNLSSGSELTKGEIVIKQFNPKAKHRTINEIIELYNIKQFFDNGIYLSHWTDEDINIYQNTINEFERVIALFFSGIDSSNIKETVINVDINYIDNFWVLFEKYKLYTRIKADIILDILYGSKTALNNILKNKKLSNYYGQDVSEYICKDPQNAKFLIHHYLELHDERYVSLYFPKELTPKMKADIIDKYVNSGVTNPNFLKLVLNAQSTKDLPIEDKTRYVAKKEYQNFVTNCFKENSGYEYGCVIGFAPNQQEAFLIDNNIRSDGVISITYSRDWISDNLDYPTLLNNFIYLFNYTDLQFRSSFPSNKTAMGAFESTIGLWGSSQYVYGISFESQKELHMHQMLEYLQLLEQNVIYLEEIFKWFFKTYLLEEFGAKGFVYNPPFHNCTYLEKFKTIATEIDSVLGQFSMYVTDGSIDRELFEMSSKSRVFSKIPSLINNKYYYSNGIDCNNLMFLLFSDQSGLAYTKEWGSKYDTLYQLLCSEKVFMDDLEFYKLDKINWLIQKGSLITADDGRINVNFKRAMILKDLYEKEVGCTTYIGKLKDELQKLKNEGIIHWDKSLFSIPEQNYLDYMLNKHTYSNGLDLRNKYIHGSYPLDEELHKYDYIQLLEIMVMIIIKINEEFCISSSDL